MLPKVKLLELQQRLIDDEFLAKFELDIAVSSDLKIILTGSERFLLIIKPLTAESYRVKGGVIHCYVDLTCCIAMYRHSLRVRLRKLGFKTTSGLSYSFTMRKDVDASHQLIVDCLFETITVSVSHTAVMGDYTGAFGFVKGTYTWADIDQMIDDLIRIETYDILLKAPMPSI